MTAIETACESAGAGRSVSPTWTDERIEQLKSFFTAGLSCSQIACEIGVSRNAVIGKLNRLGLARGRTPATRRAERTGAPRMRYPAVIAQRQLLRAVYAEALPEPEQVSVVSMARCSLLELGRETCRWPISDPDAADFSFCGNAAVAGLPYCAGHVRMAYRVPGRRQTWNAQ
jgi:GcrA cell cycle regulator